MERWQRSLGREQKREGECDVCALQASRDGGHTRTAGGEDGSSDDEVEGAQIKDDDADVGARRSGTVGRRVGRRWCRCKERPH